MFKSRFQIAGEALAIAALSASAAAQNPQAPINPHSPNNVLTFGVTCAIQI